MEFGAIRPVQSAIPTAQRRDERRLGRLLGLFLISLTIPLGVGWRVAGATVSPAPTSTIVNPVAEGQQLAARLRDLPPAEASRVEGFLEILPRVGPLQSIPMTCTITPLTNGWEVAYVARGSNATAGSVLAIIHRPGQLSVYRWGKSTNMSDSAASPGRLLEPFAGSDFWAQDLGLDFLHWPQQRVLRAEMSRGQPCRVLQSTHPNPPASGYGRVLSWVDVENGGIIQAEAYDKQGKLLKKFTLGSFEKVEGQWRLRNMRIRNTQTGSLTDLKFELNKPAN